MALFGVLGIYFLANCNDVELSALFFGMALSLKAGGILYLPAFLGTVQYRFGLIKLIAAIIIVFGYQILVAVPFTVEALGGRTEWTRYI